jgi:hypothetical protein
MPQILYTNCGGDLAGTYPNSTFAAPYYTGLKAAFAAQVFN